MCVELMYLESGRLKLESDLMSSHYFLLKPLKPLLCSRSGPGQTCWLEIFFSDRALDGLHSPI